MPPQFDNVSYIDNHRPSSTPLSDAPTNVNKAAEYAIYTLNDSTDGTENEHVSAFTIASALFDELFSELDHEASVFLITPPHNSLEENIALKQALEQAGMNVISSIPSPVAVAATHAKSNLTTYAQGGSELLYVVDVGGHTTDLSVVHIGQDVPPPEAKGRDAETGVLIRLIASASVKTGGQELTEALTRYVIEKHLEEEKNEDNISKLSSFLENSPLYATSSLTSLLLSACEKAKTVLSANTHTVVRVNADGVNLKVKVKKEELEELVKDIYIEDIVRLVNSLEDKAGRVIPFCSQAEYEEELERLKKPKKKNFSLLRLIGFGDDESSEDVPQCPQPLSSLPLLLMGGGSRVPSLQVILQTVAHLGREERNAILAEVSNDDFDGDVSFSVDMDSLPPLLKTVNTDEAAVIGGLLIGSNEVRGYRMRYRVRTQTLGDPIEMGVCSSSLLQDFEDEVFDSEKKKESYTSFIPQLSDGRMELSDLFTCFDNSPDTDEAAVDGLVFLPYTKTITMRMVRVERERLVSRDREIEVEEEYEYEETIEKEEEEESLEEEKEGEEEKEVVKETRTVTGTRTVKKTITEKQKEVVPEFVSMFTLASTGSLSVCQVTGPPVSVLQDLVNPSYLEELGRFEQPDYTDFTADVKVGLRIGVGNVEIFKNGKGRVVYPDNSESEEEKHQKKFRADITCVSYSPVSTFISNSNSSFILPFSPIPPSTLKHSRKFINSLKAIEKANDNTENTLNDLEAQMYSLGDIEYDDEIISVSTEEERESVSAEVEEILEWLDDIMFEPNCHVSCAGESECTVDCLEKLKNEALEKKKSIDKKVNVWVKKLKKIQREEERKRKEMERKEEELRKEMEREEEKGKDMENEEQNR
eukprot:gnl/Carplike_NY0171/782_a1075_944.p1 GENE.gnl/Carplike_NY0171/782_a1075_944~~gnl/Carplike_NY0171/782_a1075_944.p1  ORF type:complete len:981 (-),score=370.10 gnl/Carplike_NY0171/782_a1075_944:85-2700(-)